MLPIYKTIPLWKRGPSSLRGRLRRNRISQIRSATCGLRALQCRAVVAVKFARVLQQMLQFNNC